MAAHDECERRASDNTQVEVRVNGAWSSGGWRVARADIRPAPCSAARPGASPDRAAAHTVAALVVRARVRRGHTTAAAGTLPPAVPPTGLRIRREGFVEISPGTLGMAGARAISREL